jgi:hypothetical protein
VLKDITHNKREDYKETQLEVQGPHPSVRSKIGEEMSRRYTIGE